MSGVNQITIVGNVGSAPELSYGQNNIPFCRFSVAVNEQWKTDGEKRSRVTWFPITAFNALAESCANYVDRGRLLAVQGRVQTREYEDREGTKHQVMQVVAEKVTFLGAAKARTMISGRLPGNHVTPLARMTRPRTTCHFEGLQAAVPTEARVERSQCV